MKRLFTFMMLLVASTAISFAVTWTVAGTAAAVNGSASWAQSNSQNDMVSEDGVNYALTVTGCTLEKGVTYEYKVVKDHSWAECYPSANKTFTVSETAVYTVVYKFNATTHDVSEEVTKTGAVGEITHAYSLAGTPASVFGEIWNAASTTTDMQLGTDGLYWWKANEVTLTEGTVVAFKVVVNHDWGEAYPASDYKVTIDEDGVYDLTFTFNATTKEVNCIVEKKGGELTPKCPTPTFSLDNNNLMISSTNTSVSIYYTTDGSTPTKSSTKYTGPITLIQNCTVKAIAVAEGYEDSEVAEYVVNWISEALTESFIVTDDFIPTGGQEIQVTDNVNILFGEDTWKHNDFWGWDYPDNWTFVYGMNKPVDEKGELYSLRGKNLPVTGSFIKMTPNKSGSLRVKLWVSYGDVFFLVDGRTGFATSEFDLIDDRYNVDIIILDDSCRVTKETTKNIAPRSLAPRRSLNIGFGGVSCNFNVEANHSYYIGCPNGANFYGVEFADTIAIINDATTTRCRKIIADSHVTHVAISIVENTLYITSETPNASIYYTIDGSTPTKSSTKYTGPITLTQNCTIKAIAVAEGYEDSEVATYEVDWFYILGDVNDDGKVDVRDYIAVANDILGITQTGFNKKAADVTEDGVIDVTDYLGVGNIIHTGSPFGNSEASRSVKKTATD